MSLRSRSLSDCEIGLATFAQPLLKPLGPLWVIRVGLRLGNSGLVQGNDPLRLMQCAVRLLVQRRSLPETLSSRRLDEVDKRAQRGGYEPPSSIIEERTAETLPPSNKNGLQRAAVEMGT
jgi:hypothetical protein